MSDTPETDAIHRECHAKGQSGVPTGFARKLERERDQLRDAVRNLQNVKGRHHTEVATLKLFALIETTININT